MLFLKFQRNLLSHCRVLSKSCCASFAWHVLETIYVVDITYDCLQSILRSHNVYRRGNCPTHDCKMQNNRRMLSNTLNAVHSRHMDIVSTPTKLVAYGNMS